MSATIDQQSATIEELSRYDYGWRDADSAGANARRGLNEDVVRDISAKKSEPEWMLDLRLKGLRLFDKKPMPQWGSELGGIDFDTIKYFVRSTEKQANSWEELPADIRNTYDRLVSRRPRSSASWPAWPHNTNQRSCTTRFARTSRNLA